MYTSISRRLAIVVAAGLLAAGSGARLAGQATPRMPDGKPDLSGSWDKASIGYGSGPLLQAQPEGDGKSVCVLGCPGKGVTPVLAAGARAPLERPKYKPQFQAKVKELEERQIFEDPAFHCRPPGVPRIGPPPRIVQTPREVVFFYDDLSGNFFRIIPTDGRPHRTDLEPSYLGDAVGKWEGDTLVIETTNFNTDTWLIDDGAFHSDKLRVVERLSRKGDVLEYQATAEDPEVLAEPFVMRPRQLKRGTYEIAEAPPCVERDVTKIPDLSHHDNPR
jgi:hypothetical protein